MARLDFKTSEQKESSFEPIPAGRYKAVITEVEEKETSKSKEAGDKSGFYLNAKFQILEGDYANRVIFHKYNHMNPSAQAQAIGRGQLAATAKAVGKVDPNDTDELMNLPMFVTIAIKADAQYGPQNEIKKWEPCNGQASQATQTGSPFKKR